MCQKGVVAYAFLNLLQHHSTIQITSESLNRDPSDSQSSTGVCKNREKVCVLCLWDLKASHGKTSQFHPWALESRGRVRSFIHAGKESKQHNHVNTLWFQSKYFNTWTSIQLPCLCNVSFTESGPLADGRPNPVFISGWKDGVEEHPPSGRRRDG